MEEMHDLLDSKPNGVPTSPSPSLVKTPLDKLSQADTSLDSRDGSIILTQCDVVSMDTSGPLDVFVELDQRGREMVGGGKAFFPSSSK